MAVRTVLNASISPILEVVVDGVVLSASCARKLIRIETLIAEIVTKNTSVVRISSKISQGGASCKTISTIKIVINYSCYICASRAIGRV